VDGATEPEGHKQRVREQYDEVAASWHRWAPIRREQFGPATELMLDLARLGRGDSVLDVAAGDGYQSIAAARRVGSDGYVLAVDLAPELLRYANTAALEAGLAHVETRVMDGENLDLADASFDAVLCQFGLALFPDPDRGLREMLRVLRPGGRASVVTFAEGGTPEAELMTSIVRGRLEVEAAPPEPRAGVSLGAPGVLTQRIEAAGFRNLEAHELSVPLRLGSASDAVRYLRETHPALDRLTAQRPSDERVQIWREVERTFTAFEGAEGFVSPSQVLVAAGMRPLA
jgi:ubiquinone/menaquinone biosynthesis C-methylase UbiE